MSCSARSPSPSRPLVFRDICVFTGRQRLLHQSRYQRLQTPRVHLVPGHQALLQLLQHIELTMTPIAGHIQRHLCRTYSGIYSRTYTVASIAGIYSGIYSHISVASIAGHIQCIYSRTYTVASIAGHIQ